MSTLGDWLNNNLNVVTIIISWVSRLVKWILIPFKPTKSIPPIKTEGSIHAGRDIIIGDNNIEKNSNNRINSDPSVSSDMKHKKEILFTYLKKYKRRSIKELTKDLKGLLVKKDVYKLIYFYSKIFKKVQVRNQRKFIEGVGLVKNYKR